VAQLTSITSEALQAAIRRLLPSQQGFGEDLQASNVITPIIDLTATAEGSDVPGNLQQALAYGSQTTFAVANSSSVLSATPGFYRIIGVSSIGKLSGATTTTALSMSDGITPKDVWRHDLVSISGTYAVAVTVDIIAFLATGISISATSDSANAVFTGSIRQVANVNGDLVNPSGFNPQ
jgi:hypothetical protein